MAMLDVSHLNKSYGSVQVLEDLSFTLDQGHTLSVIGSSGSGKTTLLRCLNFLEQPDSGEVRINGTLLLQGKEKLSPAELQRRRQHFGLVFQSFNLFPQYTALENVTLARLLRAKASPDWRKQKQQLIQAINSQGRALLAQVGLENWVDRYPHQLSGGQQQRVAIARALSLSPDVLCFDEPTSALDPELTGEVLSVIRDLSRKSMTMVIVTHEMAFAREVADQVLFMDGGRIIEQGPPQQVIDNPTQERTRRFLARYREHT